MSSFSEDVRRVMDDLERGAMGHGSGVTKYILVVHKNGTTYVPELCALDEDGTLVKFYSDGALQLAVPREDFLFAVAVER